MSDLLEALARRTLAESEMVNSSVFVMDFGASTPIQGSPLRKKDASHDFPVEFQNGHMSGSVFLSPTFSGNLNQDASPELIQSSGDKLDFKPDGSRSKMRRATRVINSMIWRYMSRRRVHRRNCAARKIQIYLRSRMQFRQQRREDKFILNGKWSFSQAEKVFSLLLAHRVRRIMRLPAITHAVTAIRELATVIADIPNISSRDAFATSLSKQILLWRYSVWARFFDRAVWVAFPLPGFWDINKRSRHKLRGLATIQPGSEIAISQDDSYRSDLIEPVEKPIQMPSEDVTSESSAEKKKKLQPVALSVLLKSALASNRSSKENRKSESFSPYTGRPDPDERLIKPAMSDGLAIFSSSSVGDPQMASGRRSLGDRKGRKSIEKINALSQIKENNKRITAPVVGLSPVIDETITAPIIDLYIRGASKLIPATKGKVQKDSSGSPIPDRQPSLRITVLMPRIPGGTDLKSTFSCKCDYPEHSLNPIWDRRFKLPLPVMSGLSFFDINDPSKSAVQGSPPAHHATFSNYESAYRSHFKWWGCGAVKIEIVDIDRFNEDIFMGEATILMSSLLGPIKDIFRPLRAAGDFELQKRIPTDRVSGFVSVSLSVCMPNIAVSNMPQTGCSLSPVEGVGALTNVRDETLYIERLKLNHASKLLPDLGDSPRVISENEDLNGEELTKKAPNIGVKNSRINLHSNISDKGLSRHVQWTSLDFADSIELNYRSHCPPIVPSTSVDIDGVSDHKAPIISSRLSQRINKIKKNKSRLSDGGDDLSAQSSNLISIEIETGTSLLPLRKVQEPRVYSRNGTSSRLDNVCKDLACLEVSLQTIANAAIGSIAKKIEAAESFAKEKHAVALNGDIKRSSYADSESRLCSGNQEDHLLCDRLNEDTETTAIGTDSIIADEEEYFLIKPDNSSIDIRCESDSRYLRGDEVGGAEDLSHHFPDDEVDYLPDECTTGAHLSREFDFAAGIWIIK